MVKHLVIADPELKTYNGHYFHYDESIVRAADLKSIKTDLLSNRKVTDEVSDNLNVIPCFSFGLEHSIIGREPSSLAFKNFNVRKLTQAFVKDLREAEPKAKITPESAVLFHTITHRQIFGVVDWLKRKKPAKRPTVVLLLRYAPSPNPFYPNGLDVGAYTAAFAYLESAGVADNVRLVTDSEHLRFEYELLTTLPISVLPIPHINDMILPSVLKSKKSKALRLTYLGNARSSKGFQFLPGLLSAFRKEFEAGELVAEIQGNLMFEWDLPSKAAVSLLRQMPVTLHDKALTAAEYDGLLSRSDIVIVPYQMNYYYAQTSGVLAEAIGMGKSVIVPRGTWAAHQLKGVDARVQFLPECPEDMQRALRFAIDHHEMLVEQIKTLRATWVRTHNPDVFVGELLNVITGGTVQ